MRPKAKKKKVPQIRSKVEYVNSQFESKNSLRTGYNTVGISFDPNETISNNIAALSEQGLIPSRKELLQREDDLDEIAIPADPTLDNWKEVMEIPELKPKGRNVFLAPMERKYWARLVKKYGDNYEAMARDIKLNNFQHTKKICEKKVKIFQEMYNIDETPKVSRLDMLRERKQAQAKSMESQESKSESQSDDDEEEEMHEQISLSSSEEEQIVSKQKSNKKKATKSKK